MKRTIAIVAVTVLVLGGGAVAFAATTGGGGGDSPANDNSAKKAQVQDCLQKFRQANPNADPAARKAARQDCLRQAGVDPQALARLGRFARNLTQEQKDKIRQCVQDARQKDPNADRAAKRAALRTCAQQAGVTLPAGGGKGPLANLTDQQRQQLRQCLQDAKKAAGQGAVLTADQVTKCLQTLGVTLNPDQQAKLQKLQDCRAQVRKDNPDAKGPQLRQLVRQCVQGK